MVDGPPILYVESADGSRSWVAASDAGARKVIAHGWPSWVIVVVPDPEPWPLFHEAWHAWERNGAAALARAESAL